MVGGAARSVEVSDAFGRLPVSQQTGDLRLGASLYRPTYIARSS